jgi:antitoxin (DNA-binding transcriptional repressor) of toxin-antitoxin stability system
MTQLGIHQAGDCLAHLIARARAGEEVIILENGKPGVRMVPSDSDVPVFGALKGRVEIADDFDDALPPELLVKFNK